MPAGTAVDLPPNVLAAARVPQLELLPHLHAVIFHGGHNTMCEALAHGLPLVVAPIRDDQPANAAQIEQAHAGVRVKFGRVSAAELRDAVLAVLDDPSYAAGAARIRDSFAAAGGADAAAARLEALA
jgi:MGT family glycosyltransferase